MVRPIPKLFFEKVCHPLIGIGRRKIKSDWGRPEACLMTVILEETLLKGDGSVARFPAAQLAPTCDFSPARLRLSPSGEFVLNISFLASGTSDSGTRTATSLLSRYDDERANELTPSREKYQAHLESRGTA
jgi:hypothetical protein